jgi:hypothetical protein
LGAVRAEQNWRTHILILRTCRWPSRRGNNGNSDFWTIACKPKRIAGSDYQLADDRIAVEKCSILMQILDRPGIAFEPQVRMPPAHRIVTSRVKCNVAGRMAAKAYFALLKFKRATTQAATQNL